MPDDVIQPTDSGQMPSWAEIKNQSAFQGLSPDQQLVVFDRWHNTARTQLAQTDPLWAQRRTEFDTNANQTAHALGQSASQAAGQDRASTPDEARYRIAKDKISQDPNATLPPDIADAYYKGPPEDGRNFQIVGNQLKLFPGHHVEGMQDLVNHGIKDQEWFNQNSENAGTLDKQYNDLVTSAGSNPQLKALIDSGVKSYIGIQGGELAAKKFAPPIIKWLGARLAAGAATSAATAVADPELAAGGEVVEPLGGGVLLPMAVHALAFLGGMMVTNKATQDAADQISKYSDAVKSFESSAQLHPNYAAAGGVLGFGPQAVKSIPELIKMFSEPTVNVAGHTMSGARAAIMQMGVNGAASVPLTFVQAGMEGRLPTLSEGVQNAAIGMLLAGSPHDTPNVARAKGDATARIEAALQEAGKRTAQGAPETAKTEVQQVKLTEAQKIMDAAKQDNAAAPIALVDKAEAKAGDHFAEDGKLFRMNEQGKPEEVLPPAVQPAEAATKGPQFAENREAAVPDETGYRRYVENGSQVEEGPNGERRIVGPAEPAAAGRTPEQIEQERAGQNADNFKTQIMAFANQQALNEGVPRANRPARVQEIIAQEQRVEQQNPKVDNDMLEAYRRAHVDALTAAGKPVPAELQKPAPNFGVRTPPKTAQEIGKAQREAPEGVKLPAGVRYDGTQELGDTMLHQFTDHDPNSPSYRATFYVNAKDLTTESLATKAEAKKTEFANASPIGKAKREADLWGKAGKYLTDEQKTGVADRFVSRVTDLFEQFKPHKTIKDAAEGKFLKDWYEKFGNWMLDLMGPETPRFARLFGAFGANNSPVENATRALDVWNTWVERGRPMDAASVDKILEDVVITDTGREKGRTAKDIMAWGKNVKRVLTAEDPTKIKLSGPKVVPYSANFLGDMDRATLDRHMGIPYALQQGLPLSEAMAKGSQIFGKRVAKTPEGDVLGGQGFPGMAYEAHLRHAAEIISERTGERWHAANIQEAIWGKYQPMKMLAEEMGVKLDDLLSGKVKYSKERLSELRAQIQPETILEHPKVRAEIDRFEQANQPGGAERGAPTTTPPGEQSRAGAAGAGIGTGSEHIATSGGPVEISKSARDQGWDYLDKNRGWESEDDKHVRGLLEGVFPEMFGGKTPLFKLIAAENSTGHEVWVHADGSSDIYFDSRHILNEMGKQIAEGKTPEQYARKALTEEIVHKLTAVDPNEAQRLGKELITNTPDLARSIAERYFSGGTPEARERQIKSMLGTPKGNVHLYYEAVMDNALAQLRGEDRRAEFEKMPQTLFEHVMKFLSKILTQIRGRSEYNQFSPEMKKMVDTGIKGMSDLDQLYEQRFGKPFDKTEVAAPARDEAPPATVNVGLNVAGKEPNTPEATAAALEQHPGVKITRQSIQQSATEPTMVADLNRPLTPDEAHKTAADLGQEAIAHYANGKGELYGPQAENWRPFNPAYFLNHEGTPIGAPTRQEKIAASLAEGARVRALPFSRALDVAGRPGELANMLNTFASDLEKNDRGPEWQRVAPALRRAVVQIGESFAQKENIQMIRDAVKNTGSPQDLIDALRSIAQARENTGRQGEAMGFGPGEPWIRTAKALRVAADAIEKPNVVHADFGIGAPKREETGSQKMQARWENGKLVVEPAPEAPAGGGMAVRVREQRMPGEVQTGAPRDPEQLRAIGEGRLAKGEDPQQVLNTLTENGQAAKPEDIALFQAQTRKLSAAVDAAKASGDNAAAEKAYVQEKAWRDQLAPFQQAWHESGVAMQEPENLSNEYGMQRAFEGRYGKEMTEPQKKAATKPVKAVKTADEAVTKATESMDKAVAGIKDDPKIPIEAKALAEYFKQRKGNGGEFVGAPKRTEDLTFTPQEVKQLWKFSKPIIEQLQTYGDVTRAAEHVSNALDGALSPDEVRAAWAQPKRVNAPVSKELFEAMSKRRAALDQAKSFLDRTEMSGFEKWTRDIMDFPRTLAILGHANPLITHAGRNLFTPEAWSNWGSAFVKQFKFLVDPAAHEIAMQRILEDPFYQEAKLAGLRVSPYELEDYSRYNKVLGQLLGSRLAAVGRAGNRAMDALKVFRMEMYKQYVEDLVGGLKGQDRKDAAKAVATVVNHISGYSNNAATRFFKDIGFAPGLEGSRWAFIGDYKNAIRTTAKLATGQAVNAGERAQAILSARRAAQFVGMMAGAMLANHALIKATGQDDDINWTDSTQTDFMRFKWNGKTLDPTGGLFQPVRLLARLTAISAMEKGEKQGAFMKEIANYATGKANPGITAAIEMVTGQDAIGRALPGRESTTSKEPYTASEYALTKAPIPVAEMSKVIHDGIARETSPTIAGQVMSGLFGLGFGVLGVKQGETPAHEWTPRP